MSRLVLYPEPSSGSNGNCLTGSLGLILLTRIPVFLIPGSTLETSDFNAQMSGIKILKADEILRPVYKNRFPKY